MEEHNIANQHIHPSTKRQQSYNRHKRILSLQSLSNNPIKLYYQSTGARFGRAKFLNLSYCQTIDSVVPACA